MTGRKCSSSAQERPTLDNELLAAVRSFRHTNATVCGRSPLPGEFPHFGIAPLLPQLALGQGVADRRVVYDGFVHRVVGIPDRHRPGEGQFPGSEFRPTRNSSSEICANIEKVVKKNS